MNTKLNSLISSVWAKTKPFKSLLHHMIDVGCCANILLREGPSRSFLKNLTFQSALDADEICKLLCYLSALHDIGKCHPQFQAKGSELPQANALREHGLLSLGEDKYNFRHELYTEQVLQRIWAAQNRYPNDVIDTFGRVLALHHQGKTGDAQDIAVHESQWQQIQDQLEREIFNVFQPPLPDEAVFWKGDAFAIGLTGLIILADWIASAESYICDERLSALL